MLKLDHLTFRYKGTSIEFDFSLEATAGEIIGVMGQSGSGKSTLLELIAGFLVADSGEMSWRGMDMTKLAPEHRPVTTLFQQYNLFEHLSASRNVELGLKGEAEPGIITDALRKVGLKGVEDQIAETLSGGQQQRVALARALVRKTPILLLDEPFIGLDEDNKAGILFLIKQMAEVEQRCVIMVTHDQSDCEAIATRQYRVNSGRLVAS